MNVNWSEAPEWADVYVEDLQPDFGYDTSGWYREEGCKYVNDRDHWYPEEEGEWIKVHRQSESVGAAAILSAAKGHLEDRAVTYDKPEGERSMAAAVAAFNEITGDGVMNTEERGWLFMCILKAVRSQQGDFKADNYEDGAAYFALTGEAAAKERVAPTL